MTRFKGSVCADVGYRFEIDAPDGVDGHVVDKLLNLLLDYQAPDMNRMDDAKFKVFLEDIKYNEPELYSQVKDATVYFDCVHRDYFVNEIES